MTEAEWLACTNPEPMLLFFRGRGSDRKPNLFACACCRRIEQLLPVLTRNLVEAFEQFVDGAVGREALVLAGNPHGGLLLTASPRTVGFIVAAQVQAMTAGAAWPAAWSMVSEVRRAIRTASSRADTHEEAKAQAALVREIFGNLLCRRRRLSGSGNRR